MREYTIAIIHSTKGIRPVRYVTVIDQNAHKRKDGPSALRLRSRPSARDTLFYDMVADPDGRENLFRQAEYVLKQIAHLPIHEFGSAGHSALQWPICDLSSGYCFDTKISSMPLEEGRWKTVIHCVPQWSAPASGVALAAL